MLTVDDIVISLRFRQSYGIRNLTCFGTVDLSRLPSQRYTEPLPPVKDKKNSTTIGPRKPGQKRKRAG